MSFLLSIWRRNAKKTIFALVYILPNNQDSDARQFNTENELSTLMSANTAWKTKLSEKRRCCYLYGPTTTIRRHFLRTGIQKLQVPDLRGLLNIEDGI
jgi:hypothetical protein